MTFRDLTPLFEPRNVVLVGASGDPMKWGGWFTISLLDQPYPPRIHLVNRRGGTIRQREVYRDLSEVPERPDLVVLTIPAAVVPAAVEEALDLGARAIAVIAAGFGEAGEEGAAAQNRLVAQVRAAGAVLLGPNCLGLADLHHGLNAAGGHHAIGGVALASQSGNLALEISLMLAAEGLGFSRFASVGNQADVTVADVLVSLVDHRPTRVAACYVEDPTDGPLFVEAMARLEAAGKPVLVLKAGRSIEGARAAQSHTGALAGSARVFDSVVRDAGGILVRSPAEMVERAKAMNGPRRLRRGRPRVAILADGGGHGVLAADLLVESGFALAALSAETSAAIEPYLSNSRPVNPVDLAGAGEADIWNFHHLAEPLLAAPEVDAVLLSGFFGGYVDHSEEAGRTELAVATALAASSAAREVPLFVHSMQVPRLTPAIARLREEGVPCFSRVEDAVVGLDSVRERAVAPAVLARPVPPLEIPGDPTYVDARRVLDGHRCPLTRRRLRDHERRGSRHRRAHRRPCRTQGRQPEPPAQDRRRRCHPRCDRCGRRAGRGTPDAGERPRPGGHRARRDLRRAHGS